MKTFPEVPVMLCPFCQYGDKSADFSADANLRSNNEISYKYGIPIQYSLPSESGGSPFQRKQMNRLMYNATIGTFMHEVGYPVTFDADLSKTIDGYPLGANLKWVRLVRNDRADMPENWKFPAGGVPKIVDLKSPQVGDVASSLNYVKSLNPNNTLDKTVNDNAALYVYVGPATEYRNYTWALVEIESIASVVSMIENNVNDFRTDGPTWKSKDNPGNGWAYAAGTVRSGFWPDYSQLTDDNLVYSRENSTSTATSDKIKIATKGWLVMRATRTIETSSFTTLGDLMNCYSDGIGCSLWAPESSNAEVLSARQFGGGDTVIVTLPVSAGTIALFSLTNKSGQAITFKVWNIGTKSEV